MSELDWLSDEAWAALEPHLPKNRPGARRGDDRRVISGILHVLRSGCRWKDCPSEYGSPTTIYNRYNRWSAQGLWRRIFERLAAAGNIPDELSIDSAEGCVDEIANARMAKKQRMRWSPRGAHCVATVRAAVLNDRLKRATDLPGAA